MLDVLSSKRIYKGSISFHDGYGCSLYQVENADRSLVLADLEKWIEMHPNVNNPIISCEAILIDYLYDKNKII